MARTTIIEKVYSISQKPPKNEEISKLMQSLQRRVKRKPLSAQEKAKLSHSLRKLRLNLLVKNKESAFLHVSEVSKQILN